MGIVMRFINNNSPSNFRFTPYRICVKVCTLYSTVETDEQNVKFKFSLNFIIRNIEQLNIEQR